MQHRLHGRRGADGHEDRRLARRRAASRADPARARPSRDSTANAKLVMGGSEYSLARMSTRLKVALLFGGRSGEHEVSLRSALSVAAGLAERHDVLPLLVEKSGAWRLQDAGAPRPAGGEPVFLAAFARGRRPAARAQGRARARASRRLLPGAARNLRRGRHGAGPVRARVACPTWAPASRRPRPSMDKAFMKSLFAQAGLPQVEHRVLLRRDADAEARLVEELGLPLFVKPANLGSSVAVSKVKAPAALAPALELAVRLRPQGGGRARPRRARDRGGGARQRRAARLGGGRDRSRPRVLRLRFQVREREQDRAPHPRAHLGRRERVGARARARRVFAPSMPPATRASTASSSGAAGECC